MRALFFALIIMMAAPVMAEDVEKFGGLQSTKKDGVIVIEISPTADLEKLRRQAEIDGQKGRAKAKQAEHGNLMRERQRSFQRSYSQPHPASKAPEYKTKSRAEAYESYHKRKLREIDHEQKKHVGGYSRRELDRVEDKEKYHKYKLKDIKEHPEDY